MCFGEGWEIFPKLITYPKIMERVGQIPPLFDKMVFVLNAPASVDRNPLSWDVDSPLKIEG